MIRTEELHFAYGTSSVLTGVDLEVEPGEILTILGPNGCGKSTLLRLLRGLLTPTSGRVSWDGVSAHRIPRRKMAQLTAVVPQFSQVAFSFTVREVVTMGLHARRSMLKGARSHRQEVEHALALTDTLHLAERSVEGLSGGEHQRVLLARALAQGTKVLMLDEATSHLDLDHRMETAVLLERLNREHGLTVVQVSHDFDLAAEISHRIVLMTRGGEILATGSPAEVLTTANIQEVFGVDVRVEADPYSGAPRVRPVSIHRKREGELPTVHVFCGGGSGGELLRKLHLFGFALTAGPLNRGDSDAEVSQALEVEAVLEEPFCPISEDTLKRARELCLNAGIIVVGPTAWGPGNLNCLDLVCEVADRGVPVYLVDAEPGRDFVEGRAWAELQRLGTEGKATFTDTRMLLDELASHVQKGKAE